MTKVGDSSAQPSDTSVLCRFPDGALLEDTEAAATVTETTEFDTEPETSAQTSDPSETTEEKPS